MRFLSVCSGIEAASVAWSPLGWKAVAFSEIEPFPSAVLKHHYPDVPNLGDMTKYESWPNYAIDLLCGGTPCQSFSVAGLRKGLADPRGNLMLTFGAIAAKYRPKWLVWENVPGVLSSSGGRDFGAFLGMLGQLGYGFAYRVLDAQYFGVAQRRRRVFVVGCLGNWRAAAAVLFERHSLSGHPAPSREAGKAAPTIPSRGTAGGGLGTDFDCDGGLIPAISQCITTGTGQRYDTETETILPVAGAICGHSFVGGPGGRPEGAAVGHFVPVAFPANLSATQHASAEDIAPSMGAKNPTAVAFRGERNASTYEADASSLLRTLRDKVGAETVAQWGSRILDSLQSSEILRAWLHGASIRLASSDFRSFVDDSPLPRAEGMPARAMREVWKNGPDGRTPQGRGLAKQLAYELGEALQELPHAGTFRSETMCRLRSTSEGARAVRKALSEVQEVGRSTGDKDQPAHTSMQVRRLTPTEAERLQGFPDSYTQIPWRKKPASECPDGPRYKALGNSWAVPNVRWIGRRIDAVDAIRTSRRVAA